MLRIPAVVCRDDELRTIEQALAGARAGQGGALFVVGEGGIGKSRLSAAAADLGSAADMCTLRGRASPIGPTAPFRLLTEALMSLQRSGEPLDVTELGPYRPVLARLVPDWGAPAPAQEAGSLVILAEAVLRLTALAGRERGCLMILDDLQNSDAESLAVVDYLVENLAGQPAMLLGAASSDPCPALDLARSAAQRGSAGLLELRRLDRDEIRRLAGSYLECDAPEVPEELAEQLWADSGGVPLMVEEMLGAMLHDGLVARDRDGGGWHITGKLHTRVTGSLTRTMAARLDKIGPQGRDLLSVAAILGPRFPVSVLQAATGLGYRELLRQLHAELTAEVVVPDDETPDWYAFQHPLVVEALLTLLTPDERSEYARRVADAMESVFEGLPGDWCQASAALRLQAGDTAAAGRLFTEAGRRALAEGAADTAVNLLDRALEQLDTGTDAQARADALSSLLLALAEAGLVERAVTAAAELDEFTGLLDRDARAKLHTRLAWAAAVAGRSDDGLAQVEIARRLLGPDATDRDTAPVDVVAAHLMLDLPGPDQVRLAESLARRAADVAESAELPMVACQAWQLLGALSRRRDPQEATACLEHARSLAVQYELPIEEIHALIRLGNDEALRDGVIGRLEHVRQEASDAGAVTARFQAETCLILQSILFGDFEDAGRLLDQVLESTARLRLMETLRYGLLLRVILAAHQGRRREMDLAFTELRRETPEHAQLTPREHGLARAWCALLEEDRELALEEQGRAMAAEEDSPSVFPLTGRYGMRLLLQALDGKLDWPEYEATVAAPASRLRWDRQFALFASAVLYGRAGRGDDAAEAVEQAVQAGEPYATGRNLGLRLVAEAAIADDWGNPVEWLRGAEEYFHSCGVSAVAGACRALMRQAGVRVTQRRPGFDEIPSTLRAVGVTVREYEVFQLLARRLGNREIATRLHLSPRTVEKHVASLLAKTGLPKRTALSDLAERTLLS
ncbi:LuxR family transcriptional regulator [Actinomadura sp. DC4]|uniref:helix-turn-helix transcriptional regulator n=1 Tax=Actinomadura sp. DC4 TaxID=3055069 RepID=UPI0025B0D7DE|nr:LuxR family transcriptional regulator [Actinomadura sp. DC4]MDN3356447.1 AAA family ATPase [Actinomadura sp. DC4]